jgi:hypothetical protein
VVQTARPTAAAEPRDAVEWLREHKVTVTALVMIVAQLWWKAILLGHSYFRQDDYRFLDRAVFSGFGWHYLTWIEAGHLLPVAMVLTWILARTSLYNWPLTCTVTMVILAGACLAMWKMLRTLFGNRPLILIPLGIYLFSPLSLAGMDWWAVAIEMLPLELAIFMAVDAHVRYLRTRRMRTAVAATAWTAMAMASMDKGAVLPFLLLALTSAFLVPAASSRWPVAVIRVLREYWRIWVMYAVVLATYLTIFLILLYDSTSKPGSIGSASRVFDLATTMIGSTVLTGALGGPWQWWQAGLGFAQTSPPTALAQLAWAVALIAVVASCLFRQRAWRAWAIIAGWIVFADILPVALGRLQEYPASLLGVQARYVTEGAGVLAVCVAIAFVPLAGERDAYRLRAPSLRVLIRGITAVLACGFLAGSVWSSVSLESTFTASTAQARSYIATAGAAVAEAPRHALIIDTATPPYIMDPGLFGTNGYTSQVIGALARSRGRGDLTWTTWPSGVYDRQIMIFNLQGQLRPALLAGPSSRPLPPHSSCWTTAPIPLSGTLYRWPWVVRVTYSGPATVLTVGFGTDIQSVAVSAGHHEVYLPVVGSGNAVYVLSTSTNACVSKVTVGSFQPSDSATGIPSAIIAG